MRANYGVTALMIVALAGTAAICGCSDAQGRKANRELLDATDVAQRLFGKALALMAVPVNVGEGSASPLNPAAWDALTAAENKVKSAILKCEKDADPNEVALAYAMLGRVELAKGDYQSQLVAAMRQEAMGIAALVGREATLAQVYNGLVRYFNELAALSDEEVAKMLVAARGQSEQFTTDVSRDEKKLADMRAQIQSLQADNEKLIPQVRNLRTDSQLAAPPKNLELMEKALKMEGQVNANSSAVSKLENAVETDEISLSDLKTSLQVARGRVEAASSALKNRQDAASARSKQLQGLQEMQDKARSRAEELSRRLAETCGKIAEAEQAATDAYKLGVAKFQRSQQLNRRTASAPAQMADCYWALASLQSRSLQLRFRNTILVDQLAAAWAGVALGVEKEAPPSPTTSKPLREIPDFAKQLLSYLPNQEEIRGAAAENYQKAADAYFSAGQSAGTNLKWAYQGQEAAAYIGLYRLTRSSEAAEKASAALKDALENKRDSKYLASVVELERLLQASTSKK